MILLIRQEKKDETHYGYYMIMSIAYFMAMVCSNWALAYVPYPVQVICKSAKPIPVMLLGALIGRKSYTPQRYVFVFTIVVGVVLFVLKSKYKEAGEVLYEGYILLALSLLLDGVLGAVQDRVRNTSKPSPYNMMFNINAYSVGFLGIYVILGGEYCKFYGFAKRHPEVIYKIGIMTLAGVCGQVCIYNMISGFGSLRCSIVTTSRKFFTVLFSVFYNGNPLAVRQWIGMVIVFAGLFADGIFGKRKHPQENEKEYSKPPGQDAEEGSESDADDDIKISNEKSQQLEVLDEKAAIHQSD